MIVNVRDLGPLAAGLFFSPVSGITAGLIGGVERYIAGTYWDVGSYTRVACGMSTCLAGFFAGVRADIDVFAGKAEQFDDITMIGFTYLGQKGILAVL